VTVRGRSPTLLNVPITTAKRSGSTWENAGPRSAKSSVDNCYSDYATTGVQRLMDLLNAADVEVVPPQG
jgi:hypothetical protein